MNLTRRAFVLFTGLLLVAAVIGQACQAFDRGFVEPVVMPLVEGPKSSPTPTPTRPPTATPRPTFTPIPTRPTLTPTLTETPVLVQESPTPTIQPTQMAQALQLDVFESLWNAVHDTYLYPDFNGLDWDAIRVEYRQKIEAGLSNYDFYSAMKEMIDRLGDNHSAYLTPEEVAAERAVYLGQQDYVGIGILSSAVPERSRALVLVVFPGSPAEEAGILPRDSILTVNGESILDEDGYMKNLIRGPQGTQVIIEVQTPGQDSRLLTITRQPIRGTMPLPNTVLTTPGGKRIGYIFIWGFQDSTFPETFAEILREMTADKPLDGLIIDGRNNSGGANTVVEPILANFTHGTVGYFFNRQSERPLDLGEGVDIGNSQSMPLVVIVGTGTYSFGEIFAGILQDMGRAYLIGETTNGIVETLHSYGFQDGSRAWIANEAFRPLNHPDTTWEKVGVTPDLFIQSNLDEYQIQDDPAVLAGLEYFDSK